MKKFIASLVLATIIPFTANAYSAFALAVPANIAADGVAVGFAYNFESRQVAEQAAVEKCRNFITNNHSNLSLDLCKVVAYFDNQYVAVAMDPAPGTPGFGYAVASTREDASSKALTQCQQTAGPSRVGYCEISQVSSDVTK